MKKLKFFLSLFIFFFSLKSFSQDTVYFKKGLLVNAPAHYGREAIVTDILAYQLYTGNLITPVEGTSLGMDEDADTLTWQWVVTDSLNRLRPVVSPQRGRERRFGGNYLYLTYNS